MNDSSRFTQNGPGKRLSYLVYTYNQFKYLSVWHVQWFLKQHIGTYLCMTCPVISSPTYWNLPFYVTCSVISSPTYCNSPFCMTCSVISSLTYCNLWRVLVGFSLLLLQLFIVVIMIQCLQWWEDGWNIVAVTEWGRWLRYRGSDWVRVVTCWKHQQADLGVLMLLTQWCLNVSQSHSVIHASVSLLCSK